MVHDIIEIGKMDGVFKFDVHAKSLFNNWYIQLPREAQTPILEGFIQRKHTYAIKIAMLFSASEGASYVITQGQLEAAIMLLDKVESTLPVIYRHSISDEKGQIESILYQIRGVNLIPHSQLLKQNASMGLRVQTLNEIVDTFVGAGYVQIEWRGKTKWYRYIG